MTERFTIVSFSHFDRNKNYVSELVDEFVDTVLISERGRLSGRGRDPMLEGRLL